MGKANNSKGGKGSSSAPAAPAPLGTQQGGQWQGYTLCALLRALGYAGYTAKQGLALAVQVGYTPSPSTVGCQVGAGRQYASGTAQPHHTGAFTPLPAALLASITAAVGAPSKPHATTAPLPPAGSWPSKGKPAAAPLVTLVGKGANAGQTVQVTAAVAAVLTAGGKKAQWAPAPAPQPAS